MRILKINSQNRRDIYADMICESCNTIEKNVSCYDDDYFHETVIPTMKCGNCGNVSTSDYRPMKTKYSTNEII